MTLNRMIGALLAAGVAFAIPAHADDTGFSSIHSKRKVGAKTCFDGHSHNGSGSGPNRKVAELQAVRSWYGYTAGEYGSDWANINKAIGRSMRCAQSGGLWNCDVDATPCK